MRAAVASAIGPSPPAGNSSALAAYFRGVIGLQAKKAGAGAVVVSAERGTWALAGDALALLERMACESIPPFRDDKAADPLASRNAQARRPRASHSVSDAMRRC